MTLGQRPRGRCEEEAAHPAAAAAALHKEARSHARDHEEPLHGHVQVVLLRSAETGTQAHLEENIWYCEKCIWVYFCLNSKFCQMQELEK